MLHGPVGRQPQMRKTKLSRISLTPRRVRHFRMKLNAEEPPAGIGEGSDGGIAAVGKHLPSLGHRRHLVPMTHPHPHQLVLGKT